MSTNMIRFDERPQPGRTYTITPEWPAGEPYQAQLMSLRPAGDDYGDAVLLVGEDTREVTVLWEMDYGQDNRNRPRRGDTHRPDAGRLSRRENTPGGPGRGGAPAENRGGTGSATHAAATKSVGRDGAAGTPARARGGRGE